MRSSPKHQKLHPKAQPAFYTIFQKCLASCLTKPTITFCCALVQNLDRYGALGLASRLSFEFQKWEKLERKLVTCVGKSRTSRIRTAECCTDCSATKGNQSKQSIPKQTSSTTRAWTVRYTMIWMNNDEH